MEITVLFAKDLKQILKIISRLIIIINPAKLEGSFASTVTNFASVGIAWSRPKMCIIILKNTIQRVANGKE